MLAICSGSQMIGEVKEKKYIHLPETASQHRWLTTLIFSPSQDRRRKN